MPSSAVRTFTDPDAYFSGIRNLPTEGVVRRRGEFRAESIRIDLHRLLMYRADEDLPRIMRVTRNGVRFRKRYEISWLIAPACRLNPSSVCIPTLNECEPVT